MIKFLGTPRSKSGVAGLKGNATSVDLNDFEKIKDRPGFVTEANKFLVQSDATLGSVTVK